MVGDPTTDDRVCICNGTTCGCHMRHSSGNVLYPVVLRPWATNEPVRSLPPHPDDFPHGWRKPRHGKHAKQRR